MGQARASVQARLGVTGRGATPSILQCPKSVQATKFNTKPPIAISGGFFVCGTRPYRHPCTAARVAQVATLDHGRVPSFCSCHYFARFTWAFLLDFYAITFIAARANNAQAGHRNASARRFGTNVAALQAAL